MVSEIMNAVKWCPTTTERNIQRGVRCSKEYIEEVYNMFTNDKEHAHFYAVLLAR